MIAWATSSKVQRWFPQIAAALAFAAYTPALLNGFVNWDDPIYILNNTQLRDTSLGGLWRILTNGWIDGNYHPLTAASLWLNYAIGKLNPVGYHLSNVLLHTLNTALVYKLAHRIIKSPAAALAASLLFALHPMHVEAVAWATARKDALSACFMLLALLAWQSRYFHVRPVKSHLFALGWFVLAMLSKGTAVVLPAGFLLLDFVHSSKLHKALFLNKLPSIALSVCFVGIAAFGQQSTGALASVELPLSTTVFASAYNLCWQLVRFVVPYPLSSLHPWPENVAAALPWYFYASAALVIIVAVLVVTLRKRQPLLFFAIGWLVAVMLPVSQLFPIGFALSAERYSYLSHLGLCILAGQWIWMASKRFKLLPAVAFIAVLALFTVGTINRIGVWRNGGTLWANVLQTYPNSYYAHYNLGHYYLQQGQPDQALPALENALALNDAFVPALVAHAQLLEQSNPAQAMAGYNRAIETDAQHAQALLNRGLLHYKAFANLDAALVDLEAALQADSTYLLALLNYGALLERAGYAEQALKSYNTAVRHHPRDVRTYRFRGFALLQMGKPMPAIADFEKAIELAPNHEQTWHRLGLAAQQANQPSKAKQAFERATELEDTPQ